MKDFTIYSNYIQLEKPVDFKDFEAVGYFPYEAASVHVGINDVHVPRSVFSEIEDKLRYEARAMDNKWVVIFKDKVHFGTDNFAIFFKDMWAKVGNLEDIKGYSGRILELK